MVRDAQNFIYMAADGGERLENVLGCGVDEAFATLSGRAVLDRSRTRAPQAPLTPMQSGPLRSEKAVSSRANGEADDGTRTHDLLHGKQTL
jgi:hypothetical protein